ncbi:unnamed protein product [Arctogadus glacialis]
MEREWTAETGRPLNEGDITSKLFKALVKSSLSPTVQTVINKIVGWAKMPWDIDREHIIHHVQMEREKKDDTEEATTKLQHRPIQRQLENLSLKNKFIASMNPMDSDLQDDVDVADTSTQTLTTQRILPISKENSLAI